MGFVTEAQLADAIGETSKIMMDYVNTTFAHQSAYAAAVHCLLMHTPNLKDAADDFMRRRDNFTDIQPPGTKMSVAWQIILDSMTEELNRRAQQKSG